MASMPAAHEAHLWLVSADTLACASTRLSATLTEDERRREVEPTRSAARGAVRLLLGRYLNRCPTDVPIEQRCRWCGGTHGELRVPGLHVSVAHTTGLTAIAIGTSLVGVDTERRRPFPHWRHAARSVLPQHEVDALDAESPADPSLAFLDAWTRREALGKALGTGIAASPRTLDRLARSAASTWSLRSLAALPGFSIAVALAGTGTSVVRVRRVVFD
jgi:4'-phosphopantetheinyl transferase